MKNLLYIAFICSIASAQWPDSPDNNLAICAASGEQSVVKIATRDDGSCFVSWFDNRNSGYDVYMQRLDATGNAMWQTDGILIADRSYSSTMDFDLAVDGDGNAIVVYRMSVSGGDGIVVTSVDTAGAIRWHQTVQGGGTFVASPVVCTVDNSIVVGWITDDDSKFQKLNSAGNAQWLMPTQISDPAGGYFYVADIHPSIDGSVILSAVQYLSFSGNKRLKAQRILNSGLVGWDEQVAVMSNNSLQFGAYPEFVSDGNGGGFFTWYGVNPLQAFAAHILSDGTHGYGSEVQVASSLGNTQRVSPIGVADGNEFVIFFRPLDNSQNNDGIGAQRLSDDGSRMWGNAGVSLKPTSSAPQYGSFAAAKTDQGVTLFFTESSSWGNDVTNGVSLDVDGNSQWLAEFISVASTPSSKSRMVAAPTGDGVVLAWQDDRNGSNDTYGQRINSDGTLGNGASCDADLNGDGIVNVSDLLQVIGSWGPCGISCPEDIDGDGTVGVSDVLSIIADWGVCN